MEDIIKIIKEWSNQLQKEIDIAEIYLFGSSIINDGFLFDSKESDIDLVIEIPENITNAIERSNWLAVLKKHKAILELLFVELFKRKDVSKPIVSVIPITQIELSLDIHKSSIRDFFSENEFYKISSNQKIIGINKNRNVIKIDDVARFLFEFSQAIRNKYLSIAFIQENQPLDWNSDKDPAPKEIIRASAMAAYLENGKERREEKTDLKIGLSHLNNYIYSRRHDDPLYMKLHDWLNQRTLRKGDISGLDCFDYLFFSEMIFDMALTHVPHDKPKKSTDIQKQNEVSLDIDKSIEVTFYINKSGLINGKEENLCKEIINAGVNLAWKTEPFFNIVFEESKILEDELRKNPKDGLSMDKLRKLRFIHTDLIEGYKYIIYYQNHFFKASDNILQDVLTAMRGYTLTRYAKVLLKKDLKGVEEGFLQAYIHGYNQLSDYFPNIEIKGVINFGLPRDVLKNYLKTNEDLKEMTEDVNILALAANNQPLRSLDTKLLASFFIPLLVQRIIESNIDATSNDKETDKFNMLFTDLGNWSFGVN